MTLCNASKSNNKNCIRILHTYLVYTLHMVLHHTQINVDAVENNSAHSWTQNFDTDKKNLL